MFNKLQFMDEKLIEYSVPLWLMIKWGDRMKVEEKCTRLINGKVVLPPTHTIHEGVTAAVNLNEQLLLGH